MSSSVYYKFKSQRQESRVQFDGTGISVFDLKKEIILQNNLKASDIDLSVLDTNDQEYKDDSFIIPRSTSVIARRVPASRPGKGKAQMYVANAGTSGNPAPEGQARSGSANPPSMGTGGPGGGRFGTMSRRFDGRDQKPTVSSAPPSSSSTPQPFAPPIAPAGGDDEAASIAAMFAETSEQWEATQERMAQSRPIYSRPFNSGGRPPYAAAGPPRLHHQPESKPLPPGYICHRCNKKGHWIQDCPTNDDREYDNRPRVKRTTGIPRSMLKSVDISTEGPPAKGVMVTPEGGFVVAEPDSAAWERQRAKPKGLTEAEVKDRPPRDPALACPSCGKLLKDAVKTPCCQKLFCEDCIHTHLLDNGFECPACKTRIASLDKLKIDSEARAKVREYVRTTVEESRKEAEDQSGSKVTPPPKPAPETKEEEYSDVQPGNDVPGEPQQPAFIDPQAVITQLQAQLAQLMMMQSNPALPPATRMSVTQQIQQLTFQLKQAEAVRDMMAMNMMGMNPMMMGGPGGYGGGHQMGMNGMGMTQGHGFQGQGHQPNPQFMMGGQFSAYERMPVNNRRGKRDRPEEFGDGGPDSKRQYWE